MDFLTFEERVLLKAPIHNPVWPAIRKFCQERAERSLQLEDEVKQQKDPNVFKMGAFFGERQTWNKFCDEIEIEVMS